MVSLSARGQKKVKVMDKPIGSLAPYKILDLCSESGELCGKWLADLGAEVIKIDPTDSDGRTGSLESAQSHKPDSNLSWRFMNMGKQSITLNLETESGRDLFRLLVKQSDAVIESYPSGWMDKRGIGFSDLIKENPQLVFTSISPFGRTGPYANYSASDLVISALSGMMHVTGDKDRPPVRVSVPQTYLHGSAEGGVNTAIALYHAAKTGQGQHVDVSSQLATIRALMNATQFPPLEGRNLQRSGAHMEMGPAKWQMVFQAKDGHVCIMLAGGALGGTTIEGFLKWASEDGMEIPKELTDIDWKEIQIMALLFDEEKRKLLDKVSEIFNKFFPLHTKDELYERALKNRLLLAPVCTVADIRDDIQLEARNYFTPVEEASGETVHYPGAWAKLSKTPLNVNRRAPLIGEHNEIIYKNNLGISREELNELVEAGEV